MPLMPAMPRAARRAVHLVLLVVLVATTLGPVPSAFAGGDDTLRVQGRIRYTRPADPGAGIPASIGDASGVTVRIYDADPGPDELMAETITDPFGGFDVSFAWDDLDLLIPDDPDIYIEVETENDWVVVQTDGLEIEYSWDTSGSVYEDYLPSTLYLGEVFIADGSGEEGALELFTLVDRARRWVQIEQPDVVDPIDIRWPASVDGIVYTSFREIRTDDAWRTSVLLRYWALHVWFGLTDEVPDVCGGLAACNDITGGCNACDWCPETTSGAIGYGFMRWLETDLRLRHETLHDHLPYDLLPGTTLEVNSAPCTLEDPPVVTDPLSTPSAIAALLTDLSDGVDPAETGGACAEDAIALGLAPILRAVRDGQANSVPALLVALRDELAITAGPLRRTAALTMPESILWPDDGPPDSPGLIETSHPLGTGDPWPVITVAFAEPDDVGVGASSYAVTWTRAPSDPGFTETVLGQVAESPPLDLGAWWCNVRSRDCLGQWSPVWTSIGPLVVTDCNGNGVVDVCETTEGCSLFPGFCDLADCGMSSDCNANGIPDDCDIIDGASDCNRNGVLDACEGVTCVSWTGEGETPDFDDPDNWEGGVIPDPNTVAILDGPGAVLIDSAEHVEAIVALQPVQFGGSGSLQIDAFGEFSGYVSMLGSSLIHGTGDLTFDYLSFRGTIRDVPSVVIEDGDWLSGRFEDVAALTVMGTLILAPENSPVLDGTILTVVGRVEAYGGPSGFGELIFQDGGGITITPLGWMEVSEGFDTRKVTADVAPFVIDGRLEAIEPAGVSTLQADYTVGPEGSVASQAGELVLVHDIGNQAIIEGVLTAGAADAELAFEGVAHLTPSSVATGPGTIRLGATEAVGILVESRWEPEITRVDGNTLAWTTTFATDLSTATGRVYDIGVGRARFAVAPPPPSEIRVGPGWLEVETGVELLVDRIVLESGRIDGGGDIVVDEVDCSGNTVIQGPGVMTVDVLAYGAGTMQLQEREIRVTTSMLDLPGGDRIEFGGTGGGRLVIEEDAIWLVDEELSVPTFSSTGRILLNGQLSINTGGVVSIEPSMDISSSGAISATVQRLDLLGGGFVTGPIFVTNRVRLGSAWDELTVFQSLDTIVDAEEIDLVPTFTNGIDFQAALSCGRLSVTADSGGALARIRPTVATVTERIDVNIGNAELDFVDLTGTPAFGMALFAGTATIVRPLTVESAILGGGTLRCDADLTVQQGTEWLRSIISGDATLYTAGLDVDDRSGSGLNVSSRIVVANDAKIGVIDGFDQTITFGSGATLELMPFAELILDRPTRFRLGDFFDPGSVIAGGPVDANDHAHVFEIPVTLQDGGTVSAGGQISLAADLEIAGGEFNMFGRIEEVAGFSEDVLVTGGVLVGGGQIDGPDISVSGDGRVVPFGLDIPFEVGALAVDGPSPAGFTFVLEPPLGRRIVSDGVVELGGTIEIDLFAGSPVPGEVYEVISAASIVGTFEDVVVPTVVPVGWEVEILSDRVLVHVTDTPGDPADINGDGVVDFTDLLSVLGNWGACPAPCAADVDGSGTVDFGDLLIVLSGWGGSGDQDALGGPGGQDGAAWSDALGADQLERDAETPVAPAAWTAVDLMLVPAAAPTGPDELVVGGVDAVLARLLADLAAGIPPHSLVDRLARLADRVANGHGRHDVDDASDAIDSADVLLLDGPLVRSGAAVRLPERTIVTVDGSNDASQGSLDVVAGTLELRGRLELVAAHGEPGTADADWVRTLFRADRITGVLDEVVLPRAPDGYRWALVGRRAE